MCGRQLDSGKPVAWFSSRDEAAARYLRIPALAGLLGNRPRRLRPCARRSGRSGDRLSGNGVRAAPGRVACTPRVVPSAVRPLPIAGPAAALSVPAGIVYGIGRIDASVEKRSGLPAGRAGTATLW
jgi:hypothetical protein